MRPTILPLSSNRDFQQTLAAIRKSGLTFHFVDMSVSERPMVGISSGGGFSGVPAELSELVNRPVRQRVLRLRLLSEASGGNLILANSPNDVRELTERLNRETGRFYMLSYVPTQTGQDGRRPPRIDVRVRDSKLRVHVLKTTVAP